MVLIPVVVIGLYVLMPKEIIEERLINLPNVEGRLATWGLITKEVRKAPVFGVGLHNTRDILRKTKGSFGKAESFTSPHNSYLSLLVELGIVGLLAYLAIVASIIRMGLRLYREGAHYRDRWRGLTIIAIMVAYHVPSLFEHLIYHANLMHVYVYVVVGAIAGPYSNSRSVPAPNGSPGYHRRMSTGTGSRGESGMRAKWN